jgi:hypothetical protein
VDDLSRTGESWEHREQLRAHRVMDHPQDLEQTPGNRQRAAPRRRPSVAAAERALDLAFRRPPVVRRQRQVYEHDSVRGREAGLDIPPAAPAVDLPPRPFPMIATRVMRCVILS